MSGGRLDGFLAEAYEKAVLRSRLLASRPRGEGVGLASSIRRALSEGRPGLILEFKRCRPGGFVAYVSPWDFIARLRDSVDGFSVLVEPYWFCGSLELLSFFASAQLPVLAKDFVVSEVQVEAYHASGASDVLLILDLVGWRRLEALYEFARRLGLGVLVETSSGSDAVEVMASYPDALVGINARDLVSLEASFDRLLREIGWAAERKPASSILVAESSIDSFERAVALARGGADALLIGTWAMRDPGEVARLRDLLRGVIDGGGRGS